MALRRIYKKKFKGVNVQSGHIYKFRYQAWENDPEPTIIFMYFFKGTHENTGREWRFFQAINFTYIPRADRKRFAQKWISTMSKTNNPKFTWVICKARFPYLQNAVRRYFYDPEYYIKNMKEIPFEDIEKAIVSTYSKDFSKKVKSFLINKFRNVMRNRRQYQKTGKFPRRK